MRELKNYKVNISYSDYLAAYKEGGGLHSHYHYPVDQVAWTAATLNSSYSADTIDALYEGLQVPSAMRKEISAEYKAYAKAFEPRELPAPASDKEWIAAYGSIEGPLQGLFIGVSAEPETHLTITELSLDEAESVALSIRDTDTRLGYLVKVEELRESIEDKLLASDGTLISDNFQDGDGKAPFNLQVRNTTGDSVEWVAVVSGVGYGEIPDLKVGEYAIKTTKVDAGYTYTFSGKLDAYKGITITGGLPSPAGNGEGLELFVK